MITLHRLAHPDESFELNPDMIVTIEATPDTIVTLATGTKIVVAEPPELVVKAVRDWRVEIAAGVDRRNHPPTLRRVT